MKKLQNIKDKIGFWLLFFIPVAIGLWFVLTFGVNVPVHDQWRLASLYEKVANQTVNFHDFWVLHGNHRILFPRLIFVGLAFLSKWQIPVELLFSISLAIATLGCFYHLSRQSQITTSNKVDIRFYLANILTSIFLFSLVQRENLLWGFQIAWFMVNLGIAIALITFTSGQLKFKNQLIIATIALTIGSFSVAHGLLAFIALIPLVYSLAGTRQEKIKKVIIWAIVFTIITAIYLIDYHPTRRLNFLLLLQQPLLVSQYLFTLLGVPLIRHPIFSPLVGFITCLLFSTISYFSYQNFDRSQINTNKISPLVAWFSLGIFAIISELFITLGRLRVEDGITTALETSRYSTISILLIIALVQIWYIFQAQIISAQIVVEKPNRAIGPKLLTSAFKNRPTYLIFASILVAFTVVNSAHLIAQTKKDLPFTQSRLTCLELINYLEDTPFMKSDPNSCVWLLGNKTDIVRNGARILQELQFRKFAENIPFVSEPAQIYGYLDQPVTKDQPFTIKTQEQIMLGGWAIFPEPEMLTQPNLVLLSDSRQSFFATAYVVFDSPDVAKALKSERYQKARWIVKIGANNLAVGSHLITAWLYHPTAKQFVKLQDEAKVIITK